MRTTPPPFQSGQRRSVSVRTIPRQRQDVAHASMYLIILQSFPNEQDTDNGCNPIRACRIKCDETQPVSLRCITTGRVCDGYELQNPIRWMVVTAPSQPHSFLTPSVPPTPTAYPEFLLQDGYSRLSFDFLTFSVPKFARSFGRLF